MNELTQEQKLKQLDDILASAIKLGQEIINDCITVNEVKFEFDVNYQGKIAEAFLLIQTITKLTYFKGN